LIAQGTHLNTGLKMLFYFNFVASCLADSVLHPWIGGQCANNCAIQIFIRSSPFRTQERPYSAATTIRLTTPTQARKNWRKPPYAA